MGSRPITRRGSRRDQNEADIADSFEALGAVVRWLNSPGTGDLLVGYRGVWVPVEVKQPRDGRETPAQVNFRELCREHGLPRAIVRDKLEAHRLLYDLEKELGP